MQLIRHYAVVCLLTLYTTHAFAVDLPTTTHLPIVTGTPETRSTPFIAWYEDLADSGYVEAEYLVSGDANIYAYVDDAAHSSAVQIRQEAVGYTSRILVRRPLDPERFNGTVYLELLNATAGWDGDPIWQNTHDYMIRAGAAHVGLTSKPVALDFLRDKWGSTEGFATRNNERYASLEMPFFGQVWDIVSEVAALMKSAGSADNPLAGFDVKRIILTGYSQSVAYQVTYANSFHARARMPDGEPVIDGYFLAAGGATAKNVNRPTPAEESLPAGDPRNLVKVGVPVVRFQTQTEVGTFGSQTVRQSEAAYPLIRTFEMAGGAHVDQATNESGGRALARDLGLASFGAGCDLAINPIRIGFVQSALLALTDRWVGGGAPPPRSRLLALVTDPAGASVIEVDPAGNAVGGLRPPRLEVPLGTYLPTNSGPGFCFLMGGFVAFGEPELKRRYPTHRDYVEQMAQQIDRAVSEEFLLEADAMHLHAQTEQSTLGR
ncbi:MAG: alpha/beta hydrolase domain-containing protein [Pseudomonadales bacterium]